jgi:hypothetical protein
MNDQLLRAAFETRLAAWAAAQDPAIPIAFQNVDCDPPKGRYARCFLLPAPTQCDTLGGEHRRLTGVFQVSLCMPPGEGPGDASALAESLDAAFPLSTPIVQGGLRIFLLSPMSQGPAIQEPDRYVVPVSCTYRADAITG